MPKKRRTASAAPQGRKELIVVMREEVRFRASAGRFAAAPGFSTNRVASALERHRATMRPLFGPTEERVRSALVAAQDATGRLMEDLSLFYAVDGPENELEEIRRSIEEDVAVEAAYIKPAVELPTLSAAPRLAAARGTTPDYSARQGYLNAAPGGVDARWSWGVPGGTGKGVRIIDIEGDWRFTHEDLLQNQSGIIATTKNQSILNDVNWRNHGTAVLGEYSGDKNGFGVVGISYDATAMAVSHGDHGSAWAIQFAASKLRPGDVMLLEMHRPGPKHNYQDRRDQAGYIAVEWWPDDFAAIVNATRRGIIVVEAAGNGAENLDDPLYEKPHPNFPSSWRNPFRRANRDSGAIVVGAGAPPGNMHGPDRSRLGFSNYGALVDAQGWGEQVTTCGYGNLQGGSEDVWYTSNFNGTSSASPIVTGVVANIQGMADARGVDRLTPERLRALLRATGSPQQDAAGRPATQRIGNRPDLKALAAAAFGAGGPQPPAAAADGQRVRRRAAKPRQATRGKKPAARRRAKRGT